MVNKMTKVFSWSKRPSSCCDVHSADPLEYENFLVYFEESLRSGDLFEELSAIEHEQWVRWNKALPYHQQKRELWVPYNCLTEKQKNKDRVFARLIVNKILDQ